ncbi:MAG: hypothetical protein RBG13Loki_4177 [Promethearchaeota archaeon CR_4]|nr:MAG: hypothetical protein RBG13Loki_4177 [Candidatus Lokiarchaeota archaeon CR_4]
MNKKILAGIAIASVVTIVVVVAVVTWRPQPRGLIVTDYHSETVAAEDWTYYGSDADEWNATWNAVGDCTVYLMLTAAVDSYYRGDGLFPEATLAKNDTISIKPPSGGICIVFIAGSSSVQVSLWSTELFLE